MNPRIIATANGYGSHFPTLSRPIGDFVKAASSSRDWSIDIGCAWGSHSLAAIKAGARLIAIDPCPAHLSKLKEAVPKRLRSRLKTRCGKFHDINLPSGCSAVLAANVLHFMSKRRLRYAIAKIYRALRRGGRVFTVTWAGSNNLIGWWPTRWCDLRKPCHEYSLPELKHMFEEAGFLIERAHYHRGTYDRQRLMTLIARRI